MQPSNILSILALAVAVGFGAFSIQDDDEAVSTRLDTLQREQNRSTAALDQTLLRLTSRLDALERTLSEAPRVERTAASEAKSSHEDSATRNDGESGSSAASKGSTHDAENLAVADYEGIFSQLADPTTSFEQSAALWKKLAAMGKLDDAIARLEERAKLDPANTALQLDLANGYLNKLYAAANPIDQGTYATKMDACYDHVLEHEPENWEARFSKAISYSHWPAITGKPAQAVKQFEQLVKQQESKGDLRPEYASTYAMLGNLYLQQGKADLAKQMVEKGASLFPQNGDLKKQLEALK